MNGPISAIKYPTIQALFALLSCTENDQERERSTLGWKRKHISSDHKAIFNQYIGFGWMDAIKCSNVESWNVALASWLVVSSNEHLDTAEDDDGLDELEGMETRACIFDKRGFIAMDDTATFKSMHATATFTNLDEDAMMATTKNTITQRHLLILCDPLVGIRKERKDRNLKAGRGDWIIPTSL
ncbi:predicted protein [Lichtheimia corymbifera JMRC:FSU:9682]|uniref:Uncharacterized protein n=1 Tax=Lichtheimia corymbifera JMRC:FSU:9682 TaxID=1263082 RepID=A0A068RQH9_9FUNG|nr:predicted protein [Lichtheimia corymbifera JMRC:FSU:9682]